MDMIKSEDLRREIKKGLSGGYFFFGDEDYLKLHTLADARSSICSDESFAFFNDIRLDPLDLTPAALIDALTPLPMMADKKIVSISGLDISAMKPTDIDALCEVFEALDEYDFNVLIISIPAGCIDEGYLPKKPSSVYTKLSKHLRPVRFDTPGQAKLIAWCEKHFEHNGVSCSDDICRKIFDRCGTSMYTLAAEIDKLSFYVLTHGRNSVSAEDIPLVTCSIVEADAFALTNALLDGKNARALEVLAVMKYNRIDPVIVLSEISRAICDLSIVKSMLASGKSTMEISSAFKFGDYKTRLYAAGAASKSEEKLSEALRLCAEADNMLKNSYGTNGYNIIEQLLCSL